MAAHSTANISFTGHSLGGGLASVLANFFEKEATTGSQAL
ncbi:MAG: lipase family protein [Aquabacterium sp.]